MTQEIEILIVGTGRCGTGFMNEALIASGISCGHEEIFTHWDPRFAQRLLLNNTKRAESAWPGAAFIGTDLIGPRTKIVHLTRAPMKVIKSLYDLNFYSAERRFTKPLNQLMYMHTAINPLTQDRLFSAVQHYYEWNNLTQSRLEMARNPYMRVKLEDIISGATPEREALEGFLDLSFDNNCRPINQKLEIKKTNASHFDTQKAVDVAQRFSKVFGDFDYELPELSVAI